MRKNVGDRTHRRGTPSKPLFIDNFHSKIIVSVMSRLVYTLLQRVVTCHTKLEEKMDKTLIRNCKPSNIF